jgi:DNA-binding response OmpR family regulator
MTSLLSNAIILAVDDNPEVLSLLHSILASRCKELIVQSSGRQVLQIALKKQPDLILLDVMIGKTTGYEVCNKLKANYQTQDIPIIFLSGLTTPENKVHGFEVGGVDYIAKPFNIAEMLARIESCLVTHHKIRQSFQNHLDNIKHLLENLNLPKNEMQVLNLYLAGYKRSEIAEKVCLSENTIKWHLKQIFKKLGVDSRAALIEKIRSLESINL